MKFGETAHRLATNSMHVTASSLLFPNFPHTIPDSFATPTEMQGCSALGKGHTVLGQAHKKVRNGPFRKIMRAQAVAEYIR